MPALLAIASAVAYGVSDFVGGACSRRGGFTRVALVTQLASTTAVLAALGLTAHSLPGGRALGWGAASGIGSGLGGLFLYRGFARARMGVVAPLSAVGAAVLPVAVGLAVGERPSALALAGVGCALPAVWFVARSGSPVPGGHGALRRRRGVLDGLAAGAGFGLLFVALQRAGTGHGLWPVAAGQVVAVAVLAAFAISQRKGPRMGAGVVAGSLGAGALSAAAVVLYSASTGHGLLVLVAVLASLYPGMTVLLARFVLRERMGRGQQLGLALAGVAIVLIVV